MHTLGRYTALRHWVCSAHLERCPSGRWIISPNASTFPVSRSLTCDFHCFPLKGWNIFPPPSLWIRTCDLLWITEWCVSDRLPAISLGLKRPWTFLFAILCFCHCHVTMLGWICWSQMEKEGHMEQRHWDKPSQTPAKSQIWNLNKYLLIYILSVTRILCVCFFFLMEYKGISTTVKTLKCFENCVTTSNFLGNNFQDFRGFW